MEKLKPSQGWRENVRELAYAQLLYSVHGQGMSFRRQVYREFADRISVEVPRAIKLKMAQVILSEQLPLLQINL